MIKRLAEKMINKIKSDYNFIAEEFSNTREYNWDDLVFFKNYIKNKDKVLDLGCGNGRLIDFLKEYEVLYLGMDISGKLLDEARKKHPKNDFKFGDFTDISLPDNYFDTVFLIASFHHLPSLVMRKKTLSEIKRVLKPGGYVLMTVWNLYQPKYQELFRKAFWRSILTLGIYDKKDLFVPWGKEKKIQRYYYAFELEELRELLEEAKFKVKEFFLATKGEKTDKPQEAFNIILIAQK